jgi:hypothetical protein
MAGIASRCSCRPLVINIWLLAAPNRFSAPSTDFIRSETTMKWNFAILFFLATNSSCWSFVVVPTRSSSPRNSHEMKNNDDEPDLFEYFDPLLSPHAYPNGISPEKGPLVDVEKERLRSKPPKSRTPSFEEQQQPRTVVPPPESVPSLDDRPRVDPAFTFDPTLSPHVYAKGTPDVVVGDADTVYVPTEHVGIKKCVLGILLIDHGSRNAASNKHLHEIARVYQESVHMQKDDNVSVIVKAAHMEIATPSIRDGIRGLLNLGVDEIVCHPYFLSPGRHVQEDIPRILEEAIEEMNVAIPIATTSFVGSNIQVMINAIHSMVQETTTVSINKRKNM